MSEQTEPALEYFEVIGPLPIVDARTGDSVRKPGVVALDPEKTVISWLVDGGHVKPLPKAKAAAQDKG